MKFTNLSLDTQCHCLENTFEDLNGTYVRKINKDYLRQADFLSHWEKSEIKPVGNCDEICGLKGVSVSKFEDDAHFNLIIASCLNLFKIAPKYKPHLCFFKFKTNIGVFKNTPNDQLIFHHDLYKSDEFSTEQIEAKNIVSLSDHV